MSFEVVRDHPTACQHPECKVLIAPRARGVTGPPKQYCVEHSRPKYYSMRAHMRAIGAMEPLPPREPRVPKRLERALRAQPPPLVFSEERTCAGCRHTFIARDVRQRWCNLMCWETTTRSKRNVDRRGQVHLEDDDNG